MTATVTDIRKHKRKYNGKRMRMKHLIVGTAGHIDHGKTSLIKMLTGTNTDRLQEEQKRGITIDIGFASLDLPSGTRAGIVDVPGHERFIRNMLAGIGGVDVVILVVAADEGMMPQTREHLDILSLLEVKSGIVALTKCDMVDAQWVELVTEELREELKSTFLQDAPIIPISSVSGMGREELLNALDRVASETDEKSADARPRLPIDRAFVLEGIGTVVTGTLVEGSISVGDVLELYPPGLQAKVRSIESHGEKCETIYAGQRTAINLSGLKKDEISRGFVLAKPGTMHTTDIVDCKLRLLKGVKRSLGNRARVRLHHGTSEIIGRMVLLNESEASGGDELFVQILLEEEIAVKTGDRFILRNYSPVTTIGGGVIIDAGPVKHKRFQEEVIEGLNKIESGEAFDLIEQAIYSHSKDFEKKSKILLPLGLSDREAGEIIKNMGDEGIVFALSEEEDAIFIHRMFYEKLAQSAVEILSAYHKKAPLEQGMSKEEFRMRLTKKMGITANLGEIRVPFKAIEDRLIAEKLIDDGGSFFKVRGFQVKVDNTQQQVVERLMKDFEVPATPFEVLKGYEKSMKADLVFRMLVSSGKITKLSPESAQDTEALKRAILHLREKAGEAPNKDITLAEARDHLGISRKQALAILEYLDKNKITKKIGDSRIFL